MGFVVGYDGDISIGSRNDFDKLIEFYGLISATVFHTALICGIVTIIILNKSKNNS